MSDSIAPVLVELTRGKLVECSHRGALAIASPDAMQMEMGNCEAAVFPRSAIKALQCISVVTSGAADRFAFSAKELALCCASHSGTPEQTQTVRGTIARLRLGEEDLACGPHPPFDEASAHTMLRANAAPNRFHNNCSGKHAGMLATAVHLGVPTQGYQLPEHPVQERIRFLLERLTGLRIGAELAGTDGCSVPNWALPLRSLASVFARFVALEALPEDVCQAAERIAAACWAHPEMLSGPGRLDSRIVQRFGGDVFVKTGAEGVYCGGIRSRRLGFALKIEDGAKRAAETVAAALVGHLTPGGWDLAGPKPIYNWHGSEVGEMRLSNALEEQLIRLSRQATL